MGPGALGGRLSNDQFELYLSIVGEDRAARLEAVLDGRTRDLALVFESIHDTHNISAVLRTADAFGIQSVHIVDPHGDFEPSRKITQGCHKWLDLAVHPDPPTAVEALRSTGHRLLAATLEGDPAPLPEVNLQGRVALVFGNERDGLTPEMVAACDSTFFVPMRGFSQSLNLSVAAAVTLQHARAARAWPPLPPEEREQLRRHWYKLSAKQTERIEWASTSTT